MYLEYLHKFTGGDETENREMCESFLEQADDLITELAKSTGKKNSKQWVQTAHKLKGSAASLGAFRLANMCSEAQNAPSSSSPKDKKKHLENIKKALAEVKKFCESM